MAIPRINMIRRWWAIQRQHTLPNARHRVASEWARMNSLPKARQCISTGSARLGARATRFMSQPDITPLTNVAFTGPEGIKIASIALLTKAIFKKQ